MLGVRGSGVPQTEAAYHLSGGVIPARVPFGKFLTGVLCIGAALDFIAGTQDRAPSLARRTGMEWAWRMLREPRRLGPRYVKCMTVVPRLVARTIPQIVQARMRKAA